MSRCSFRWIDDDLGLECLLSVSDWARPFRPVESNIKFLTGANISTSLSVHPFECFAQSWVYANAFRIGGANGSVETNCASIFGRLFHQRQFTSIINWWAAKPFTRIILSFLFLLLVFRSCRTFSEHDNLVIDHVSANGWKMPINDGNKYYKRNEWTLDTLMPFEIINVVHLM